MTSRTGSGEDPGLFDDLPLQQKPARREGPIAKRPTRGTQASAAPSTQVPEPLPLFADEAAEPEPPEAVTRPAWRPMVPFVARFQAGLIDLGVVLGVMLLVWAGLWWLGVEVDLVSRVLVVVFLLPFSYLYQIFPLAFWGCTPGMARMGIVARSRDGQTLTFSQAGLRWLGSVLTVAAAGLPMILTATTGRSLADRLSASQTHPAR